MRCPHPLAALLFLFVTFTACGGGSKSSEPDPTLNVPPTITPPPGLAGTAPSFSLTLPLASTQSLLFTAADAEGGLLSWQVSVDSAAAAAAGITYPSPAQGTAFTVTLGTAAAAIAVDMTILVEDAQGGAAAIDLRVLRSGPPTITGVSPASAFATRPETVRITGTSLRLGGVIPTSADFDLLPATNITVPSETELRCSTPANAIVGPTVVRVSNLYGSSSLPANAFTMHTYPPDLFAADVQIDAGDASALELVRAGSTVHAVWRETAALVHRVSTDAGQNWSSPQTLSGGEAVTEPQLVVDGDVVVVAWIGDGLEVWQRRSADGGVTFAPAVRLDTIGVPTQVRRPRLAQSGAFRYAAWVAGDSGAGAGRIVVAASADAGATWAAPTFVSDLTANQQDHEIACDGAVVCVVCEDDRLGSNVRGAYAARSIDAGATWLPAVRLNTVGTVASTVRLTAAGARLFATWVQAGALLLATSPDRGTTWSSTVVELQPAAPGAVTEPDLACDEIQLVAAFVVGGTSVRFARFTPLGATVQRVTIESAGTASAQPEVALSGNYVFAAWREGDVGPGTARVQFATSTNSGSAFDTPAPFGDGTAAQTAPRLVVDGANLLFGWLDSRGATTGVFVNRTES